MADRPVFLYAAVYDDIGDAEADRDAVFDLHAAGAIGTFDAAVIEKEDGKVHVHKTEKPTQHGAWTGIAVGAVAGILFPPSIIAGAIVGGAAGGVLGHLWRGMSRGDLKDLGEALDEGDAALIVIGESKIGEQIERAAKRARKVVEKQLQADADNSGASSRRRKRPAPGERGRARQGVVQRGARRALPGPGGRLPAPQRR